MIPPQPPIAQEFYNAVNHAPSHLYCNASNGAFHRALEDMRVPHEYREFPGRHDWDYWDLHVLDALAFHARALGLAGAVT